MALLYRRWRRIVTPLLLSVTTLSPVILVIPLPILAQTTNSQQAEADQLLQSGRQSLDQHQYPASLKKLQQALKIYRELGIHTGEANVLRALGFTYWKLSQPENAVSHYRQALSIFQKVQDFSGEADVLNNLSLAYNSLSKYDMAIESSFQALSIFKKTVNRHGEAHALKTIGSSYNYLSKHSLAIKYFQQALPIFQEITDRNGEAYVLSELGLAYRSQSSYSKAIEYFQQSLYIFKTAKDRSGEAKVLNELGQTYYSQSNYGKAIEYFQLALPIFWQIRDRSGEAIAISNFGTVYNSLGEYKESIEKYRQALVIFREIGNRGQEAYVLNNLGLASWYQSQSSKSANDASWNQEQSRERSANYSLQAVKIFREVKDHNGEAISLINLGLIYSHQENKDKAINYFQQARDIARQVQTRDAEARALNYLGYAYMSLSKYYEAFEYFSQASLILRDVGNLDGEASALNNIGELLERQKQPELAIIFYKKSVLNREMVRQSLSVLPKESQQSYAKGVSFTYRRLSDLLLQQDRVLEAQQILDLLRVQELDDYFKNVRGTAQTIEFRRAEQEILDKYTGLQKNALEIGSELSNLRKLDSKNALDPAQKESLSQLVNLETALNAQFGAFIDSPEIKNLAAKLQKSTDNEAVNLYQIRKFKDQLQRLDAVLLYPLILDDRLELVLSIPGSPPLRRTVNVKREELNRTIAEFRSALGNRQSNTQELAEKLYGWLIKPIEADLTQANRKTILYSPDGQLRYIPLAALHDGKQWLIERYRVNNITALAVSDLVTPPRKDQQILAAAFGNNSVNVTVDNQSFSFAGLPFATKEVQSLAQTRPGTVSLFDRDFSLSTLRTRMNSFNILHLATHGKFLIGNPKKSFLVMGNGDRFSLSDIQDSTLDNVDLVVLSACETGVGLTGKDEDGIEVLGIGYQFQRGGAKAAISSLWSINDGGTQKFMEVFYGLLQQGMPKAEALQQAQVALIKNDFTANGKLRGSFQFEPIGGKASIETNLKHPFYWAPFILIGNGL